MTLLAQFYSLHILGSVRTNVIDIFQEVAISTSHDSYAYLK